MRRPVAVTRLGLLAVVSAAASFLPLPAHAAAPAFSGFSTGAVATPLEMDVYEPTIPLPASPQGELELGYSKANAETGQSRSRASLLWPGAAVGEGFKTIADAIGLPPDIGKQGYPLQANATYPGGPTIDSKDTAPGAVMRTSAGATSAESQAGYAGDCDVRSSGSGDPSCPLPATLAQIARLAGSSAATKVTSSEARVLASAEAAADRVSLLGLLTVWGVSASSTSTSDGRHTKGIAHATYTGFALAGEPISLGPDGAVLPGQTIAIPGLPADPNAALSQLGVTITVPRPTYQRSGSLLTSTGSALIVQIDCGVLRHKLDALPVSTVAGVVNSLPDDLKQVKALLGAALYLSPRLVFTLGEVQSSVNTAQGITLPPLDLGLGGPAPPVTPVDGTTPATSPVVPGSGDITAPPLLTPPGIAPSSPLVGVAQANGLPRLYTLPVALLIGTALAALLVGGVLRRLTWFLLGADSTCPHGLHNGLPDLRKA